MDSPGNIVSDASETNFTTELESEHQDGDQMPLEEKQGSEEEPMDVSDSVEPSVEEPKELGSDAGKEGSPQKTGKAKVTAEETVNEGTSKSAAEAGVIEQLKVIETAPEKEGTPKKTVPVKSLSASTQSITIVMSPSSSGQKTQTVQFITQEQMSSMPMQAIQVPLKTSPIVLKATTIPMPTKTVSIVAKPAGSSTSPTKVTSSVILPSTSKTPTKTVTVRKGVVGVGKGESSSKSDAALHQMVRSTGGITKAKLPSARVIVVPLQITKEMIAAKQKAAGKSGKGDEQNTGKSVKEPGSKPGTVENTDEDSANEKSTEKQVKQGAAIKKKTEAGSVVQSAGLKQKTVQKLTAKVTKKLGSDESGVSDIDSENTEKPIKSQKKKQANGLEKEDDESKSKNTEKEDKEGEDSEVDEENKGKVVKVVKKAVKKKEKEVEDAEEAEGNPKSKLAKYKSDEDKGSESEADAKIKSPVAKKKKVPTATLR